MDSSNDMRFRTLYDSHYRDIYAYCRRRTDSSRVEDIVADIFLTAWRRIETVPEGHESLLWLYGVAHNVLSHHWRSAARKKRLDRKLAATGSEPLATPDVLIVQRHEAREVLEAAAKLNEKDLEVLRLAVWEELPQAEIAAVLKIEANAVKQRLHRARKRLTKELNRAQRTANRTPAAEEGGAR